MARKRHEDDDWIDEIKITIVPRYKTSGMSGDESMAGCDSQPVEHQWVL